MCSPVNANDKSGDKADTKTGTKIVKKKRLAVIDTGAFIPPTGRAIMLQSGPTRFAENCYDFIWKPG